MKKRATRTTVATFALIGGLFGLEHGVGEILLLIFSTEGKPA